MKKNKRHLYKKLPKYALGTMKSTDSGYQRGMIGSSAKFDTEQNMSLEPETQAIRKSALPNALGYIAQQTPYITEMLKSSTNASANTIANTANTITNTANTMANFSTGIQSFTPTILSPGASVQMTNGWTGGFSYHLGRDAINSLTSSASAGAGATLGSVGSNVTPTVGRNFAQNLFEHGAGKIGEQAVKKGAERVGTSTLGTAMGAVGTALGAYTMANQIADFGSHRSASDMLANVGRQHITTDMGNSYTNYNGVNAGQELAYEKANARSKQLGFGMNAIGTGASLGGMLGSMSALGSITGPLGTALGAGVGLLLGGLGSLFGWGDNSEEIERLTRLTNDNIAMYNRQQEAVAKSKDVAAEFSDRQGVATAAEGKNAYGPMNAKSGDNINTPKLLFDVNSNNNMSVGIPTSKLMPGETVFDKETLNWAVVPGKGNKDNVYSTVKPGDSKVVFTNKGGISKLGAAVLKSNAPEDLKRWQLNELEKKQAALQESENNQSNMKKYKNGKLPGFWRGTDYLMSAIPHLAALGSSWNQYNRAKYADMPDYPNIVDSSANTKAINILGQRKYNVDPVLDKLHETYRESLYNINRTPGLTAGGQAIARANEAAQLNKQKTAAMVQADEINNRYTADYANALANYGKWMSEMMTNNNYARAAFKQQQNAAKEGWMAQYQKNGLTALADLASDVMGVRQFNRSEDYQNKMLKLYGTQVENDNINAQAALANAEAARLDREAAYRKVIKDAAEKTYPMFANHGLFAPNNINNLYGMLDGRPLGAPTINRYSWMKGMPRFKDGKGGFVSRGNNLGSYVEEIQPSNILGIGDSDGYSTKMITADGDTIYQNPGVFSRDVVRKKGGPASKEYIKAKQKHERLLKNATPSYNIGMDQLLRMFGF